jgi:hypothetical protein
MAAQQQITASLTLPRPCPYQAATKKRKEKTESSPARAAVQGRRRKIDGKKKTKRKEPRPGELKKRK